jgi:tetratricopeptide (TPR) repeat protein
MKQATRPLLRLSLVLKALAIPVLVFTGAAWADGPPAASSAGDAPAAATKLKTYIEKLTAVSPRDAEGYYQLGQWCEKEGMHEQAVRAFEQAIRIDPDHPAARAALGYRPLGTDWTKGAPAVKKPAATESTAEGDAAPAAGPKSASAGASSGAAKASAPRETGGEKGADAKAAAAKAEDQVQAKKKWAQEMMAKLELKATVSEDEDFLIHSTTDSGSPRLKELNTALKQIKKLVTNLTGRPRGGPMWPGKLHFIYMRASTECMRFSETVDGQRFPEEDGYYSAATVVGDAQLGEHTVFSGKPPEKALGFILGYAALDHMGNSDRYVGNWLREGLAALVAGSTDEGKKDKLIDQSFKRTAAEIEANFEGVSIFKLLESESSTSKKNGELNQAMELTLVAFLYSLGPSKIQKLIEDLKSNDAPPPPAGTDKLFLSQYARFQENSMTTAFHEKLEKLGERWKAYVVAQAATLEKTDKPEKPDPKTKTVPKNQQKDQPKNQGKNQGKGQGQGRKTGGGGNGQGGGGTGGNGG